MPTYEFKCRPCGTEFATTASVSQLEKGAIRCPACGAADLEQLLSAFVPKTSRKT
jgi:putative FmdB family regulatory protein